MNQYIYTVLSPSCIVNMFGTQVRLPGQFTVDENEVEMVNLKLAAEGVTNYTVKQVPVPSIKIVANDKVSVGDKYQLQHDVKPTVK